MFYHSNRNETRTEGVFNVVLREQNEGVKVVTWCKPLALPSHPLCYFKGEQSPATIIKRVCVEREKARGFTPRDQRLLVQGGDTEAIRSPLALI